MSESDNLSIAFGGCTSAGIKARNEDAFAAFQPDPQARQIKGAAVCIADGVSCSENAQLASETSVTTFIQDYLSTPETWDVKTSAARVLSSLNSWLFHQGQLSLARHNGLVTTFTGVIFKSTSAHIFHLGDSRIYRYRQAELIQLSRDHSLVQSNGSATLTRALGMDSQLKVDYQQKGTRVNDIIMLSTDGVHDNLNSEELVKHLSILDKEDNGSNIEGQNSQLEKVAAEIVAHAEQTGSQDNISCMLVKIITLPVDNIDEAHRKLTKLVIPPTLEPGVKLDDYKIIRVLYSGARSHIYLAEHPRFRDPFVLKVPSQSFAEDPEYLEGFIREQWVGRRVNNAGVMKIYEPVPGSKFLYHICEYVPGQTLRQWMYDNPQPGLNVVRELAKQIAACLRVFQRMGMLHRDLKPENIMLTEAGQVKLIDFGTVQVNGLKEISSSLSEDTPVGTRDYIAPEYLRGEGGVHRSDIFSLGVVLYEMITGKLPFKRTIAQQNRVESYDSWHYQSALTYRKDVPVWVDLALKKACAPRPSARYQALSELLQDLTTPNQQMVSSHKSSPLMERDPVRFWKIVSGCLLLLLILQWVIPAI
ncbi:bifunctional protein-serine/threonine kinase/phosphatase [Gammaproteobacteria bacterium]|nr:bifunctional protein-serine/threonine kinase/phosphatase [Gammaproteobacteria bacterium]